MWELESETNPGDEHKESARDQDQTEVPARPSSPLVDKDLGAIGEEDEIHPLEKEWATCARGVGVARTYHRTQTRSRGRGAQSLRKKVLLP